MTQLGFHVALVREPDRLDVRSSHAPFVSHTRGTGLVIEHIETDGVHRS